jgi:geranylgeranyl reductase family protein
MMRYDVIVAGAGPAGSTAARECAARGLAVLLLEKAAFPRDKPCGGGVSLRAARLLPFDLGPAVERTAYGVRFSLRQAHGFVRASREPLTFMTQRAVLDTLLAEHAVRAGAVLRERSPVQAVERDGSRITVRAGRGIFESRTLVVADGANGPTARLAGVPRGRRVGIALEANVRASAGPSAKWQAMIGLDLGSPPGGYGWIFPRGDHLNVGVGGWLHTAASLRRRLERLIRFYGFDPAAMWGVRGYHLPVREPDAPLVWGNVLLTGDAAGLLDPLTGDGIHGAIYSGRAAAAHLTAYLTGTAPDLRGYVRELSAELLPDLHVAARLHTTIDRAPGAFFACIRLLPPAWGLVCRILRGDQTYIGVVRGVPGLLAARRYLRSSRGRITRPATASHSPR